MPAMPDPTIPLREFASRRKRTLKTLGRSVGVVFAGELADPLHDDFKPHPHFQYLTGLDDEPGAVLVLDPGHALEARREMLFLRPLNPEVEQWDGLRDPIGMALRERLGIKSIFRLASLPRYLNESVKRARSVACLHPLSTYDQPVSPDLDLFRKIVERVPGTTIEDRTHTLAKQRSVKSRAEVAVMQQAADISREGFLAAMRDMKAGLSEFDIQESIEHAYRTNGSSGPAYGTIVGGGINSTVLHYRANAEPLQQGDLVCIDSGAAYGGYGADVTRTIPVSGKFTKRQKEIYEIVLAAENAAIKTAKAGVTFSQLDRIARAIISKAGYADAFFHGIGHHLGIETHDINSDEPLKEGAVVTIEPGIYLPDEKLGVRIEDDVVITKTGCRVMTAKIPKTVAAVEKAMK
jgi:Xaa-Pro aminopeptidase